MKKLNFLLRAVISILIISILVYKIGFKNIFSKIISIHPLFILLVLFIFLLSLIIGALNLYVLLFPLKKKIPFTKIIHYSILSWSFGLFIPGKIGEFSLIPLLKKEGIPIGQGTAISIIDKLITLITLSIFSVIGFFIFFDIKTALTLFLILASLTLILVFLLTSHKIRNLIKKHILRKISLKFKGFSNLFSYYLKKQKAILCLNFILTFLKWFVTSFTLYILFLTYNQNISWMIIFLVNSMLTIISLIPISISGLGVRESAAVVIYSFLNIDSTIVMSTHLIPVIISYSIATLIIFLSLKELDFHK